MMAGGAPQVRGVKGGEMIAQASTAGLGLLQLFPVHMTRSRGGAIPAALRRKPSSSVLLSIVLLTPPKNRSVVEGASQYAYGQNFGTNCWEQETVAAKQATEGAEGIQPPG